MQTKTISQLIDTSYYDYALYVMESRAIPSMIDGLKPSGRKALYSAINTAKSFIKTASLTGETLKNGYHHGDASMSDAIGKLVADWNNNAPILEGEGNFGNRFDKSQSAPRYTKVRLHKNFSKFFTDNDILTKHLDPEIPEPTTYLPLIPWVLVNGTSGIAIGFACEIQPRDPMVLAKACIKAVDGVKVAEDEMPPAYMNTRCVVAREPITNRWYVQGNFRRLNATEILIDELPPGFDRKAFVARLDKLEEAGKISTYDDECGKGSNGFKFRIKFRRGGMPAKDDDIVKMFGLREILSENLTVTDEFGKLRQYSSPPDLVMDFVEYRIKKIADRFAHYISRDAKLLWDIGLKASFIKLVLDGKVKFIGESRASMTAQLESFGIKGADAAVCLRLSVSHLNKDSLDELLKEEQEVSNQIAKWKNSDPRKVYKEELQALLKS